VDVGDDTTASNSGLDESVELLVAADGQLQVARGDALHLQVLGGVTCELEHFSGEVLKDGGRVDSRGSTDARASIHSALEEAVDSSNGELQAGSGRPGLGSFLGLSGAELAAFASFSAFARLKEKC